MDLHKYGRRVSSGAIWITFNPDATVNRRLAFAIGSRFGPAVARNRARRQLRACFADVLQSRPDLFAPGDYLVGIHKDGLSTASQFQTGDARQWLIRALEKLQAS